ncbi:MAG: type IV toxin-antitoxin system AbiEi family antitoxin domain-containing protein [Bacteroidota bacterium]
MKHISTYKYIEDYLTEVLSKGRYAITYDELKSKFDVSEKAILQNVHRLKRKNKIAQVRKEFYVIIPPQYSKKGMVPPTLIIADMMKALKRDYYVGLYSAAALHGSGHQQPMEFQVITKKPTLRSIKSNRLSIRFFIKKQWEQNQIIEKKTETGYIYVSTPSLTAFDLVSYHKKIGGLNRLLPILDDLTENIDIAGLKKAAKSQNKPTIQRLGYLFDIMGNKTMANILLEISQKTVTKKVPLSLAHDDKTGKVNHKWNVIINTTIDF